MQETEKRLADQAAEVERERLRLELERQKLEHESRLETHRQQLNLAHQTAAQQAEALKNELHRKVGTLKVFTHARFSLGHVILQSNLLLTHLRVAWTNL